MLAVKNGALCEPSKDDIREYREYTEKYNEYLRQQSQNPAPPTEAERLEALENQLAGIVSAYREGVNEA